MNNDTRMEWAGYLLGIGGVLILLLMSDRPGWMWPACGVALILSGAVLVYRARRRRGDDDSLFDDGASLLDDLADIADAD